MQEESTEEGMIMKIVIAGGGRIGLQLAKVMLEKHHDVSLIEKDKFACRMIADKLDAMVICGNSTNVSVLEASGLLEADCFVAVTGSDQDNLVACQLAQNHFHVGKVIAKANDPHNVNTFKLLGVDNVVSDTELITNLLEQEADTSDTRLVATLNRGKAEIFSTHIDEDDAVANIALQNISLPKETLVFAVIRKGTVIVPNGDTVLTPGDEVVAVCTKKNAKLLRKLLTDKKL